MKIPAVIRPALKAYVAALLVILTAIVGDFTDAIAIDGRGYLGAALLATIQFAGVYLTSNDS